MRDHYPGNALVMTEFGAEGRPDMADEPADVKGSYGFQTKYVARHDGRGRPPAVPLGAIHWTLREFEIFPGWRGGAVPGPGATPPPQGRAHLLRGPQARLGGAARPLRADAPVPLRGASGREWGRRNFARRGVCRIQKLTAERAGPKHVELRRSATRHARPDEGTE